MQKLKLTTDYVEANFLKESKEQVEIGGGGREGGGTLVQYKPAQSETCICIMYIFTRFLKLMTEDLFRPDLFRQYVPQLWALELNCVLSQTCSAIWNMENMMMMMTNLFLKLFLKNPVLKVFKVEPLNLWTNPLTGCWLNNFFVLKKFVKWNKICVRSNRRFSRHKTRKIDSLSEI